MNHPFFYLSIAAVASFYCIFFLSILRDLIRGRYADGSKDDPKKPSKPTKKFTPTITSVVLAHWVTGEGSPASPIKLFPKTLIRLSLAPSLSIN